MLSLRSGTLSLPVLGAMRQTGRGLRRADPVPHELPGPKSGDAALATVAQTPDGMPPDDWGALFDAVTARLQRLAGRDDAALALLGGAEPHTPLQECVDALQQLHQQLGQGLQGDVGLRAELAAVCAQLVHTRNELAQAQVDRQHAEHAALHDVLTRLPNRGHFHARLASSLAGADGSAASLAVLYLDLDGFKRINDEHGHDTGDATLCIVARRLAQALRAQDTVCRLGGDEFACLLVAPASREQLSKLARKLFDAVAAPLQVGTQRFSVQPSMGIAMYPVDGTSGATLLKRADAAMFRAKRRQQGYAFFERGSDL
ncbi:MAG: GGDEF domain-containing protein [Rubrivivax sp.]|nr:GGDEF domain-containing protein [Rubrivivax sp.]